MSVMERSERLLTTKDAAERLAVSVPTLERLLRRGAIPSVQVAGTRTRRIRQSDIDAICQFGSAVGL